MNHPASTYAHETIADFIFHLQAVHGHREDFFTIKRGGRTERWTCQQMMDRVHELAASLEAAGLQRGERVVIFAENRPEWHLVDFTVQVLGGVSVPIFPNLPSEQVSHIVTDSGASWVFYSDAPKREMLEDLGRWLEKPPTLVSLDDDAHPKAGHSLAELLDRGGKLRPTLLWSDLKGRVTPDDLSSLLYTSGTTGQPKGVMLTHRNLATNMLAACRVYPGPGGEEEQSLCFLPLSHVFARTTCHTFMNLGIAVHYVGDVEELPDALMEVKPTVMASVPLVFEKAFQKIQQGVAEASGGKKALFEWAVAEGEEHLETQVQGGRVGLLAAAKHALADRLVHRKIQERFGGRLKLVVAGGAPMPKQVETFFQAVGVGIYVGYGLTETSPMLTINYPGHYKPGSTGKPAPGAEIKIARDGEVLARGPGIMRGYWRKPDATAQVIDENGWFATGDLGAVDDDGFLFLTGRKKDMIITADGNNVAPVPIEHLLVAAPVVAQAVVIGDDKPHLSALLVPDYDRVGVAGAPEDLARDPRVIEQIASVVDSVNRLLAKYEHIRAFRLLPEPFKVETGELTPTLKVRRPVVMKRFAEQIDDMYRDA